MAHACWGGQHKKASAGSPAWARTVPLPACWGCPSASPSVPVGRQLTTALHPEPSWGGLTLPFSEDCGAGRLRCCWALLLLNVPFVSCPFYYNLCIFCVLHVNAILLCIARSCPILFCDPLDYSPTGSPVHRILQARILQWVAIYFSRGSFQPRYRTCASAGGFFTAEPPRKPWF